MGDTGSMFLGGLVVAIVLRYRKARAVNAYGNCIYLTEAFIRICCRWLISNKQKSRLFQNGSAYTIILK